MKVISLHQPWASWVALGWKTIETRTHSRFKNLVGQTIGIHAAKHWDKDWNPKGYCYYTWKQFKETRDSLSLNAPRGFLIATAYVEEFRLLNYRDSQKAICCCDDNNLFGLVLSNIARIEPIKMDGRQGIFNYEGEIIYL